MGVADNGEVAGPRLFRPVLKGTASSQIAILKKWAERRDLAGAAAIRRRKKNQSSSQPMSMQLAKLKNSVWGMVFLGGCMGLCGLFGQFLFQSMAFPLAAQGGRLAGEDGISLFLLAWLAGGILLLSFLAVGMVAWMAYSQLRLLEAVVVPGREAREAGDPGVGSGRNEQARPSVPEAVSRAEMGTPTSTGDLPGNCGNGTSALPTGRPPEVAGTAGLEPVDGPPPPSLPVPPRVLLPRDFLARVRRYMEDFLDKNGRENEAGGTLFGRWEERGGQPVFKVLSFVEAGPRATFSSSHIDFDYDFTETRAETLRVADPGLQHIGCIHRHPGNMDHCSGPDRSADAAAARISPSGWHLSAIVTLGNPKRSSLSLYCEDYKFDFFVIGNESGNEYVQVRPEIGEFSLVEPNEPIARLVEMRGKQAAYDLRVIKDLLPVRRPTMRLLQDRRGVQFETEFQSHPGKLTVLFQPGNQMRVFLNSKSKDPQDMTPAWIGSEPYLGWITDLVLRAAGFLESEARKPAQAPGKNWPALIRTFRREAPWYEASPQGMRRLALEEGIMQKLFGERFKLARQPDGRLSWKGTIAYENQTLEIAVIYPDNYPSRPPEILALQPLKPSPHQLLGNLMCWIDTYSSRCPWDPGRDTAAMAVGAARRWFMCYLIYLVTKRWPQKANH